MSIELKPSKHYPGRTGLHHKTYSESNMTTVLDLTPEDVAELVQALTAAGHIKPRAIKRDDDEDMIVYGWAAVDPEGKFITNFNEQQRAINYVDDARRMAKAAGLPFDFRVAAIVDQGGL